MIRFAMLLLLIVACAKKAPPQPESLPAAECMSSDRAVVVVMSNPEGYLEPCGCTSNPKGGIAKLAAFWAEQRRCQKDPVLVTVGNFLFDSANLSGPNKDQEETKAQLLSELYVGFGAFAQVPGAFDKAHIAKVKTPWLRQGEVRRSKVAGLDLAFVGVEDAQPAALPTADVVIALSSRTWQQNRELKGFDVIVSSGSPEPYTPAMVGNTLLIEAGTQGQYVGMLELVQGEPSEHWRYYDAGASDIALMRRQLLAAQRELNGMDGKSPQLPMYRERVAQLTREIAEREAHPPPPPSQKYIRYTLTPLTKKMPDAVDVKTRVAGYNAKLCDFSRRATENLSCPEAKPGAATFLGSETCGSCHAAAFKQWQTQKHAQAVKTLEDAGKFCDLGCIGCHTTGYGRAGGFCSPQKVGALKEVGCEMCHGAGSLHVQAGGAKDKITRSPDETTCRGCHTKEHSDTFDFAAYKPRILGPGHGR